MKEEKQRVRIAVRAVLAAMPAAERDSLSAAVGDRLFAGSFWREAEAVLCYLSLPDEVSTDRIIARALADGKTVGVPRITDAGLAFHRIDRIPERWAANPYGIREPDADLPLISPANRQGGRLLILVPGLAFDRAGGRLGRGRGFYDRFLGLHRHPGTTAGICFASQLLASVPAEPHDQRMDIVVTDREIHVPPAPPPAAGGPGGPGGPAS